MIYRGDEDAYTDGDGIGWDGDGMRRDGMGIGIRRGEIGREGMGWDEVEWDGMGRDGTGWDRMGWDGMGSVRIESDRIG